MKTKRLMKQISGMLLAVVMFFALSVTAYATDPPSADSGSCSITVGNPIEGVNYTAYKIFDVSFTADKNSYSYSIKTDSGWYDYVKSYADTAGNGISISGATDGVCTVAVTTGFSAADFAKYLSEKETLPEGIEFQETGEGDGKVISAQNLSWGYYFVKGTKGALCNLTTADSNVTIHDKNDVPFTKTVSGGADSTKPEEGGVEVGQTLTYTITGKVPDTEGFENYVYKICDTMSEGLTFKKDVKASIGGSEVTLTAVLDVDAELTGNQIRYKDNGFELSLNLKDKTFDSPIEITYTATVNDKAVTQISENEAVLNYGRDTNQTTERTVQVFSAKINIDKYKNNPADADDKSAKLAEAKFVLRKGSGAFATYYQGTFTEEGGVKKLTAVNWVSDVADATIVATDGNGAASFAGLKNGTYYLVETAAPEGYNLLKDPVEITLQGSISEGGAPTGLTVTAQVANSEGKVLPTTGGIGTTIFYIAGLILILAALTLLLVKRCRNKKKK